MIRNYVKNNFNEIIIILVAVQVLLLAILVVDSIYESYGKNGKYGEKEFMDKRWVLEGKANDCDGSIQPCGEKFIDGESYDKTMGYDPEMTDENEAMSTDPEDPDKNSGYDPEIADRAMALVERAISDYETDAEKTLNSVKEAVYVQDDLYVFAVSGEHTVAHPYKDDSENTTKLTERRDFNGFYYGQAIANATESGKWIDYVGTSDQALKSTYCKKVQEHVLCAKVLS